MSLTLSTFDIERLKVAMRLLVSPLDHENPDQWRSAVNYELRELLDADSAGFLLPNSGGLYLYSDEHDAVALSKYPDLTPPPLPDGTSIFQRMAEVGAGTLEHSYGENFATYTGSAYYNDYAAANGACDTLAAMLPVGVAGPAGLQFWHEHPKRQKFESREVSILGIVLPALQVGVQAHDRLMNHRHELMQVMDQIGQALVVLNNDGCVLHMTPPVTAMLAADPDRDTVQLAVRNMAYCKFGMFRVTTAWAEYQLSSCSYSERVERDLQIVTIERLTPIQKPDVELKTVYGLTRSEAKVARVISEGKSNAEVGVSLFISVHTAKRHTESIMRKMTVRSRSEIRDKLISE